MKHIGNRSRRLNLYIFVIPGRETKTNRNEAIFRKITEKKVFLMQTSSFIQNKIFTHIIFVGKNNENTKENRNLPRLMEFLEINDKDF